MAVVTMRNLLDSGVHFGHQTRRWNPKMKRFIFTERNGIYIIDLQQTLTYIDRAYDFVKETVAHGGTVLFVGTKKQAQEAIAEQAQRVGMPFVNQRWLGGMLTNFSTVFKRLQRLKELEALEQAGSFGTRTKKESLILQREKDKLERTLGGIRDMQKVPSAVWVIDTKKEHIAVAEARKLGIPVVAILDTNCDPDEVDYKIPGNDDAIRSCALLTRVIADAVADGLMARAAANANAGREDKPEPGGQLGHNEPLAEWERALLVRDDAAAAATTEAPAEATTEATTVEATPEASAEAAPVEAATEAPAEAAPVEPTTEAPVEPTTEAPVEATTEAPVEATTEAPAEAAADATTEASVEGPNGPGSHAPLADAGQPEGFPVKGNADSKLYHEPGGQWYDQTVAEVWFATAQDAEKAGFSAAGQPAEVAAE